jgi:hypothetical protein
MITQKLSQTALVALLCVPALLSTANAGTPPQSTPWAVLRCTASDVSEPIAIPLITQQIPMGFFRIFSPHPARAKGAFMTTGGRYRTAKHRWTVPRYFRG